MFRNYVITAWRNIRKNGMYSFINIFGLAIGLMSCILIMLFVREETGYDQWVKDSDRIVRMHTAYTIPGRTPFLTVRSAGRMMEAIRDYASAEVEQGVRLLHFSTTVQQQGDAFRESIMLADGSFFSVFDLPMLHGSSETAFAKPFDLVLSQDMAIKYFGKTDVVGETITVCCVGPEPTTLQITGVLEQIPEATHLDINMLVYLQPSLFENQPNILDTWNSVNVFTYFKLHAGVSVEQLQERIYYWVNTESPFLKMMQENFGDLPEGTQVTDGVKHRVMALTDLHLRAKEHAGSMGDMRPLGDIKMIYTFVVVAILILLIACINFMNLATARASQRAREVAMRKVVGASRSQVAAQFLAESVGLVLIALLFALVAVEAALPLYNEILGRQLEFHLLQDTQLVLSILAISVLVGLGAGIYPALYLSRFMPAEILKASKGSESSGSGKLRTALVVVQFATSIALLISTAIVYAQTLYAKNMDVGYVSNDKMILRIGAAGDNLPSLKQQLESLPGITSVVMSSEAPTQDNENNTEFRLRGGQQDGNNDQGILLNYHHMDYGFFEAYGVAPLAGRLFDESFGTDQMKPAAEGETGNANVILNQSALAKFGFTNAQQAIGQTLDANVFRVGQQELTIVGVIPDLYFRSIRFGIRPSIYMLNPDRYRVASLTFSTSNVPGLMAAVEQTWKELVPMQPINLQFLSEMMAAQYADEQAQANLFAAFSLLAIVVACLGLYGLATFTAERKTKEIGLRKVMGARVRDIVSLLIWQFSKPVLVANIIAWPLSIWFMLQWLESFPYRIDTMLFVPVCLVSGLIALLIAWITVGGNAAKVARANPIKALRYE